MGRVASQVFVDESKAGDFLLVAVGIADDQLEAARKTIRLLTPGGQMRLHMKKESDSRRRLILSSLAKLELRVTVYRAKKDGRTEVLRREMCLRALVFDLAVDGRSSLCLERDETLVNRDRRHLISAALSAGTSRTLSYRHEAAATEPLLAVPDAIAWAWAKGGDWRRRCSRPDLRVSDV